MNQLNQDNGWIKLHRSLLDWEWASEPGMMTLWVHLLLSANHEDNKWHGRIIKRGQLVTGRIALAKSTGLSEQTVRTCLQRLIDSQQISKKSTNKYSIITICNYDKYQVVVNIEQPTINQQLTSKQPATNHKQECKNEKNIIYSLTSRAREEYKNDISSIIAEWNAGCARGTGHLRLMSIESSAADPDVNPSRHYSIAKAIDTYGVEKIVTAIREVTDPKSWISSQRWLNFDWCLVGENIEKAIQGNYRASNNEDNRTKKHNGTTAAAALHSGDGATEADYAGSF